jgi:hypothetical protein
MLCLQQINSSSDEELFALLGNELEARAGANRWSPEFLEQVQALPVGLRAMAATYELDVSLALDDVGWHFGNWHNQELAEETLRGLEELGAIDLARIFRAGFEIARRYWSELGAEGWMDWYHGSGLEKETKPLSREAWEILEKNKCGIFDYWVAYARTYPERVGAVA